MITRTITIAGFAALIAALFTLELMARRGPYSELYAIQAAAYRSTPAAPAPA